MFWSAWPGPLSIEEKPEIDRVSSQVLEYLQPATKANSSVKTFIPEALEAATQALLTSYDWSNGGWGQAPKFPQPMTAASNFSSPGNGQPSKEETIKLVSHVLHAMARGGMYDMVGGGFARYSVDNDWRVPHFEKILSGQCPATLVYLHGYQVTGETKFRQVCEETLDYILREMAHPEGGFYSSLDANSEGEEGKFYVWTQDEIQAALGPDFDFFKAAYGITPQGNWEGKTVLRPRPG